MDKMRKPDWRQFEAEVSRRQITRLVHFSPIGNLISIFEQQAILSRDEPRSLSVEPTEPRPEPPTGTCNPDQVETYCVENYEVRCTAEGELSSFDCSQVGWTCGDDDRFGAGCLPPEM